MLCRKVKIRLEVNKGIINPVIDNISLLFLLVKVHIGFFLGTKKELFLVYPE